MRPAVRPLGPEDVGGARVLIAELLSATRYESRVLEQFETAVVGDDPECVALIAIARDEERVRGLALFGTVAGAAGAVKLHALIGHDIATQQSLAAAVRDASVVSRARMIVCEIADDVPFRVTVDALRQLGFEEDGRVPDFVRDGVALLLLSWRIS